MKYHLISIDSDIGEDSLELGEGDSTGCGLNNEKIGVTFENMPAMLKHLHGHYGLPRDLADYEEENNVLHTSKTVANHSEAQNGGWMEPTEAEYELWQKGELTLYSENFTIRFLTNFTGSLQC